MISHREHFYMNLSKSDRQENLLEYEKIIHDLFI